MVGTTAPRRAAFSSIFLASVFFCSQALSPSAPAPVTQTVGRFLFRTPTFDTDKQLYQAVQRMETILNTMHRLPAREGKTPQEFTTHAKLRYLPADYDWRKRNLQLVKGHVTFVRFVRKSGRITLTAKDKFLIGKKYKWQYVLANVDVATCRLHVIWQGKHIKSFDYQ